MAFGKKAAIAVAAIALAGIALSAVWSHSVGADSPEFVQACKGTGVRFLRPPASPVTSVALDYYQFVVQAIGVPVQIPDYELKRRSRALIH